MLTFSPFRAEHVLTMHLQESQQWMRPKLELLQLKTLESGSATTFWCEGAPVLCVGDSELWPNRAVLWSFFGELKTDDFSEAHYWCKRLIDSLHYRRIEAYVDCEFREGHRWALALGMNLECERMAAFGVDGRDNALYSKLRN
jgi:hypothetical protein